MRCLGLDPGSLRFGIGVVEVKNREVSYIHAHTVVLPAQADFITRMEKLQIALQEVVTRFEPDTAAMEEGFLGKNVRSMTLVAMARGVAMGVLLSLRVPLRLYAPRLVKQSMTGYGNAAKDQVGRMAARLLRIPEPLPDADATDALAVAYCHAVHHR